MSSEGVNTPDSGELSGDEQLAIDGRSDYDYRGGPVERPDLVADLRERVDGEVRFDTYTRQLYATDASIYEATPVGVVFPTSTADVASVVSYCAERGVAVLPRGGGTSLAGQAVNEAVVLDFTRHMDEVLDVDPDAGRARVQSGVILGELNAELAPHGLKFAPDPAWGDKSAIGGAIGNNSTGSHSLVYGKTDAYLESCEVVLADGTVTTLGETSLADIRAGADSSGDLLERVYAEVVRIIDEEADEIEARYPDLKRTVSGYNLDVLVEEARDAQRASERASTEGESGTVNLAKLLAGSEGTLAVVTEATVSLEPVPRAKAVALLTYVDVIAAVTDVAPVLEHEPAAVELVDDVLIDLARNTAEFEDVVAQLPEGADSALLVEFYAEDDDAAAAKVDRLLADRVPEHAVGEGGSDESDEEERTDEPTHAFDGLAAYDAETQSRFWKLRKSGLPILLSRTSDQKHISFIEDCAIPPEHLPDYVADFQAILSDHNTFAAFYAHAGPGVLHIRPLVNVKTAEGVANTESIANAVTDLVVEYGGSVTGEHGDGRARTQWNEKLYGERLWETSRALKSAFDPDWLLNPGQVCGDVDMTENLRYGPDYAFDAGFDPQLNWENENGFEGMVELCHGCGGCRGGQEVTGGTMCPTFRASREEITATRGRANLLRQAMSGDLGEDEHLDVEFMHEVMDLCIGCKGCARDCPSEVDMAKLKAEVTHEHHRRHGASFRDRLFANVDTLSRLGSALAPLSNAASALPGARTVIEKTVGIARERSLPTFHRETLRDWFDARGGAAVSAADAERRVVVVPDTYTNYSHPDSGKAAVRVLEAAGVHVQLADSTDVGRPAFSKGFLDQSRETAREVVRELTPLVDSGWDVVLVEPSDAVMVQSDYLDLLAGDSADRVAASTYGVCEYLDQFRLDEHLEFFAPAETLTYHGHCHQKATKKDHHAVGVLRRAGYEVDPLDSGCCGMAGSFGYESEHYAMSRAIGEILFEQVDESAGEQVVAPGASCRTQLGDRSSAAESPPTPIEMVARALR